MYTTTSIARVPFSDMDFKPKGHIAKNEISSNMEAKMRNPCKISIVSLGSENYLLPNINGDTSTPSQTDLHTETKRTMQKSRLSTLSFRVRSYETNADARISPATILNYLQEGAVNWVRGTGFEGGSGLARTHEMINKNLIWVFAKTRIKIDKYPTWNDIVQNNTWFSISKNGGFSCNNIILDANTGESLIRGTSLLVMMDMNTRRLCKVPGEVKAELEPYCQNVSLFEQEGNTKVLRLNDYPADVILKGCICTPKWTDIDINQHVNNAKYASWILENVPEWLAMNYEITSMALDYLRECAPNEKLHSLAAASPVSPSDVVDTSKVLQSHHLIRFEDGADILRGRIEWKPRKYPVCA